MCFVIVCVKEVDQDWSGLFDLFAATELAESGFSPAVEFSLLGIIMGKIYIFVNGKRMVGSAGNLNSGIFVEVGNKTWD